MIQLLKKPVNYLILLVILALGGFAYYNGYKSGSSQVQARFDSYKIEQQTNELINWSNSYKESNDLNQSWLKKVKEYENQKEKSDARIANLINANARLSSDIKEYRDRRKQQSSVAYADDTEAQTAWLLFEQRRRVDFERIKDAEDVNNQLIQAKDYIDNVCNKKADF